MRVNSKLSRSIFRQVRNISSHGYSHITTPIFYPNAKPHLGHLYSSLFCDVQHRWSLLKGDKPRFTTGTDEHGLKIQTASEQLGFKDPKVFVDKLSKEFTNLDKIYNISYTRFIRTTDQDHIDNVEKLWQKCFEKGYIYKGQHKGWYSISDETFYPESKVIKDPNNPDKFVNTESNNEVIFQSEINYYFKLSLFKEKLVKLYSNSDSRGFSIFPESKRIQLLKELTHMDQLNDISISRPISRLKWGIPVPNDPSQIIYVWFDALTNYISAIDNIDTINDSPYWPETTHVIGKDILKFHALYWPSFLLAADIKLPRRLIVHDHWICNGTKMSKSLGNVVDPIEISRKYGVDIIRWFILENSQLDSDNNFDTEKVALLRHLFVAKWGNLISRCCSVKFNLQRAVEKFSSSDAVSFSNQWDTIWNGQYSVKDIFIKLNTLQLEIDQKYDKFDYSNILKIVWSLVNDSNHLIQETKPWEQSILKQDSVIYLCMEISRILGILVQPIIPQLSNKLLNRIDVLPENRKLADANFGGDKLYGISSNDSHRGVVIERSVAPDEFETSL